MVAEEPRASALLTVALGLAMALGACQAPGPDEAALASAPNTPQSARSFPEPPLLEDLDPDPGRFVGELEAAPVTLDITGRPTRFLGFNGSIPGPQIRLALGEEVLLRYRNNLPQDEHWPSAVHWHGIEGYNHSDGTPVTQVPTHPGESFEYRFRATRAGVFWYHPHERGAQALFAGLYAPLIVLDPAEEALIAKGVLPEDDRVLVLSDTWTALGRVTSAEVDDAMEIMNGTEGRDLLVNGRVRPTLEIPAGSGVRLRLVNASITRFWRLSVPGQILYRVGGQGGLLDHARVEGGTARGERFDVDTGEVLGPVDVDLGFARGEIVLAPGERADVVLRTDGEAGEEWPLRWEDFARGRHDMWVEDGEMVMGDAADDGKRPGIEVATFRLVAAAKRPLLLQEGTGLLAAVGRNVGKLSGEGARDVTGPKATTLDEAMDHNVDENGQMQMTTWFGINGVSWHPEHTTGPAQPLAPTARHARLGERLVWEVRNNSMMQHPYHLHGFSYQPYEMVLWPRPEHGEGHGGSAEGPRHAVRVRWTHHEYEDTTRIPAYASLYFRVHLADPAGDGSAAGRWMQHCHLLQHGEGGMMSELVVSP